MQEKVQVESSITGAPAGRWVGAAAIAAVLASACCLGPLVLGAIGISAAGVSAAFEPLRPVLLGATVVLLGGAFYLTYVRKPVCAPGSACEAADPQQKHRTRVMLWVATGVVALVALFPLYGGALLRVGTPSASTAGGAVGRTVTLAIDGMTCETCAVKIEKGLRGVPGVVAAAVSYADGTATVTTDAHAPPPSAALLDAVQDAGYRARVETRRE